MADPEFTETFNIEEGMWESYRRFIERLRDKIGVRYSHNHAVTPVEENPPTRFFDVQFRTNYHNIRVRFRRDNLYFVGYQMEGSNEWLELRHNPPGRQIPGSTLLSFGDSYDALRASDAGNIEWNEINFGRQEFIDAINELAISTNVKVRARKIIVILLMIAESLRFNLITKHFTTNRNTHLITNYFITFSNTEYFTALIHTHESYPNLGSILDFLTSWGDISAPVLHVDADPNIPFQLPGNNYLLLFTIESVLSIIGIFKGYFFRPGPRPEAGGRMAGDDVLVGRPLVEIFSVTINNINGNSNTYGDIYGTMEFSDGLSRSQYIYNRGTNDSESIHTSETVLLNGPHRSISAYDHCIFTLDLKSKEFLSEDNELSKGEISWNIKNVTENRYDEIIRHQVTGQNGASATVKYAVLNNTVQARIEATLIINTNGGEAIDVYGKIAARNNKIEEKIELFRKASNKYINVEPGEMIPLSRSVVAVPLNSSLIVSADLKESVSFGPDDVIANGKATFSAQQISGTEEQYISTVNPTKYLIKVKVTWSWYVF